MEESKDCYVDINILFRRRRKRKKIFREGEYLFFWRRKKNRRKRRKIFGEDLSKNCQGYSEVSVSRLLPIFGGFQFWRIWSWKKKSQFCFRKIWSRKKSIGFGFGKFGLGRKILVSVSEILLSEKKSRYRFWSKFWYRHSVLIARSSMCGLLVEPQNLPF